MSAPRRRTTPRARVLRALAVCATYALLTLLMTFPAVLDLDHRLIGNNVDNWVFYWNNWWLGRALSEGLDWHFTPYLFYPQGTSLVTHSNSFLNSLLALALRPLTGPVGAYNLTVLFGLWVGAVGMYWLVYDRTRRPAAALLAGSVFAFAPYHLTEALAHMNLASIHWWPFFALFLQRALRRRRLLDAALAGLFAGLTLWSGLQLAMLLGLWALCRLVWAVAADAGLRRQWKSLAVTCGLCAAVAVLVGLPLLVPLLRNWQQVVRSAAAFDDSAIWQTDLLAYFVPPTLNPFVGEHLVPVYEHFVANRAFMPYLGYAALALAVLACGKGRRQAAFWATTGALWAVLAAGPTLRVAGRLIPSVPMPYRLVGGLFPLSTIRSPDRLNLLLVLSLAVLAGLGAARLARRRRWAVVLVLLVLTAEYACLPLPAWDPPPGSPFLAQMAADDSRYGVVDFPMGYTVSKLWLYYQTLHGHAMVEGHVSRYTADTYAVIANEPLLRALYAQAERPPRLASDLFSAPPAPALGPALRSLLERDIRYVLVHRPYLDDRLAETLSRLLPLVPVYEDQSLTVYDLAEPVPVAYDGLPVPLSSAVTLLHFDLRPTDSAGQWQLRLLTRLTGAEGTPTRCLVGLEPEDGSAVAAPTALTLFGPLPEDEGHWREGDLDALELDLTLPEGVGPGRYRWVLSCGDGPGYVAPETLEIDAEGNTSYLRRAMGVRYGGVIELAGYRWWTQGADLHLLLQWEALATPGADYKVFVHLLDAAGQVVRQFDAMPCQWGCPTGQWQAGEVVLDQATIALAGLPAGEYRLAVGLYSAETLDRLPAQASDGTPIPDGYAILPDPFIITAARP